MKYVFALTALLGTSAMAFGLTWTSPGPLLGAVGGPWGLAAAVVGYGAYRLYKAKR